MLEFVEYGADSAFDAKKVQNHLCQTCLDKLLKVMYVIVVKERMPKLENGEKPGALQWDAKMDIIGISG